MAAAGDSDVDSALWGGITDDWGDEMMGGGDDDDDFGLVYKSVAGGDSVEQVRRAIEVCARGSAQRRAAAVNREGSHQASGMKTARDESPLAAACRLGRGDLVALLVEAGADVRVCDHATPLSACIPYGDVDTVRALLRAGIDANAKLAYMPFLRHWPSDTSGCSAAHLCLWPPQVPLARDRAGPPQLEILQILAQEGNLDVDARDARGRTPLFWVPRMASGHEAAVDLLVALGADVNAQSSTGTPLIVMLQQASNPYLTSCARKLVAAGAQTSGVVGIRGHTPLATAAAFGNVEAVHFLLAEAGVPADERNPVSGQTALHTCTNESLTMTPQVCALLLDAGADANAVDNQGRTPIFACGALSGSSRLQALRLLLGRGASADVADRDGLTPLLIICANHHMNLYSQDAVGDPAPLVRADAAGRQRPRRQRSGLRRGLGVRFHASAPAADRRAALLGRVRASEARRRRPADRCVARPAAGRAQRDRAGGAAVRGAAPVRARGLGGPGAGRAGAEGRRADGGGEAAAPRGARGRGRGQLGAGGQRRR